MKLAIIGIHGIPAQYGGFETNVEKTVPYLTQHSIDVTVYCREKKAIKNYKGAKLIYLKTIKR